MRIITGHRGTPHVTSNDEQGKNQGIFGIGNYVLNVGQKFNATMTDATTVTLEDGEGMMQGVHFRIDPGTTEAISISAGTTGYNRIDLVCARYTKDITTGIEDVSLIVIEGTPNASTPSVPAYTEGDILAGDTLAEFPLWKVTLTGLTPALTKICNGKVYAPTESGKYFSVNTESGGVYTGTYAEDVITVEKGIYLLIGYLNTYLRGAYINQVMLKICARNLDGTNKKIIVLGDTQAFEINQYTGVLVADQPKIISLEHNAYASASTTATFESGAKVIRL